MMNGLILAIKFLFQHKLKIISALSLTVLFIFLLFPFKDLNDFVSSQISLLTQKKVYLQFNDMSLNLLTTSVHLDQVTVETAALDDLTIDRLSASPSLMALLKRQPGGSLELEGLFKGQAQIRLAPLAKMENGASKSQLDISAEKISLKELRNTLQLSLPLQGTLQLNSKVAADLSMTEQPEGELTALINQFEIPSANVEIPNMGSLNLPDLKFKQVELKGKLANGKLTLEKTTLGSPADELYGQIKGDINMRFQNMNGQIVPVMGGYNLNIDLTVKPSFKDKAQFFLGFIDNYKTEAAGATQYKFKLQSSAEGMPPQFLPFN